MTGNGNLVIGNGNGNGSDAGNGNGSDASSWDWWPWDSWDDFWDDFWPFGDDWGGQDPDIVIEVNDEICVDGECSPWEKPEPECECDDEADPNA